ncbi:hypothetical protein [Zoogloea sp.]|uniref:hypothetical protein n=1 Tax=Zoogloea sp. TaxID=49181 RepID=UPI00262632A3|nr:hypothetical protein [Zoogloea sp.]
MSAMRRLNWHVLYSAFQAVLGWLGKPSDYERARQSYGPEPYLTLADVSIAERIDALVSGNVVCLLRSVLGTQRVAALTFAEHASAFQRALPLTQDDVVRHMIHSGIPTSVARYGKPQASGCWMHRDDQEGWMVSWIDERNARFDRQFNSKREAEMYVRRCCITLAQAK